MKKLFIALIIFTLSLFSVSAGFTLPEAPPGMFYQGVVYNFINLFTPFNGSSPYWYTEGDYTNFTLYFNETALNKTILEQVTGNISVGVYYNMSPINITGGDTFGLKACPNNQVYVYNVTYGGWQCQSKTAGGGGTVTQVDTDDKYLIGGPITTTGTIILNEIILNATIDARDSDTTYGGGPGIQLIGTNFSTDATTAGANQYSYWDGLSWNVRSDQDTTYNSDEKYINEVANVFYLNEAKLNDTIDARSTSVTGSEVVGFVGNWSADRDTINASIVSNTHQLLVHNSSIVDNKNNIALKAGTGDCPIGYVVQNTTTSGVECVLRTEPTTFYNATAVYAVRGTQSGLLSYIQNYNGNSINVTEQTGSPGLDFRVNFTVTDFQEIVIRYKTDVVESHISRLQFWDYDSSTWENYGTAADVPDWTIFEFGVFDSEEHKDENGTVQVRIYSESNGNTGHTHYFDWVTLVDGVAAPLSGAEVDPISIHRTAINDTQFFYDTQLNSNMSWWQPYIDGRVSTGIVSLQNSLSNTNSTVNINTANINTLNVTITQNSNDINTLNSTIITYTGGKNINITGTNINVQNNIVVVEVNITNVLRFGTSCIYNNGTALVGEATCSI